MEGILAKGMLCVPWQDRPRSGYGQDLSGYRFGCLGQTGVGGTMNLNWIVTSALTGSTKTSPENGRSLRSVGQLGGRSTDCRTYLGPPSNHRGHGKPYSYVAATGLYAIALALMVVSVPQAWSQQQASLSGIVSDPSGAVIPGATIRVTNTNTQVTITAVTNSTGYYIVGSLTPGTYTPGHGARGPRRIPSK